MQAYSTCNQSCQNEHILTLLKQFLYRLHVLPLTHYLYLMIGKKKIIIQSWNPMIAPNGVSWLKQEFIVIPMKFDIRRTLC